MPELADSYCERCGARYAFNPNASKAISLKGARVLAKGLKNFVLTDGQSMADSIAMARNEDDHQDSSKVTEAFHKTFNFCMTCRQYACDRCWNAKVGACLSCSPEDGVLPTAPQEHLIVRTPVAEWDSDWSLFPEGPAAEPVASPPPPTRFNEPIVLPEPAPLAQANSAAAPAWPISDLPAAQPVAGSNGKNAHRTSHKQADQAAASLWPITDEIAPEMTLTAEELELVESSLGQGDPTDEPEAAASAIPEPQFYDAQPMWIRQEEPAPEPPSPTGWGASWRTSSPSPWDNRTAATGNGAPDTSPDLIEEEPFPPVSQPAALAAEPQPEPERRPQRILSMPMPSITPAVPSPAPKAPQAESVPGAGRAVRRPGQFGA